MITQLSAHCLAQKQTTPDKSSRTASSTRESYKIFQISFITFHPHNIGLTLIRKYSSSFPIPHIGPVTPKWNKANKWESSKYPAAHVNMTHPQSFHEHLQFILKLFVLLRLQSWGKKLIKRRNPKHILLPFTLGQVVSEPASLGGIRWTRKEREWEVLVGRQLGFWTRLCLNTVLKNKVTMTRPGPSHKTVVGLVEAAEVTARNGG